MSNYLTFQGSLTPADSSVQEGESIHRSGNEEPHFTMQTNLPKGVRNFLRSENFSVRFDSRKLTFTLTHKTIKGYVLHDMTADEILDYAVNHCYPGYDPDPTPSNIFPITQRVGESNAANIPVPLDCSVNVLNCGFEKVIQSIPANALIATDPPFGIGFKYDGSYNDKMSQEKWLDMLEPLKGRQCVFVLPWEQSHLLTTRWGVPQMQAVWTFHSGNRGQQHRVVVWYNCKPNMMRQEVGKHFEKSSKRWEKKALEKGRTWARGSYHWEVEQLMSKNPERLGNHPCQMPEEIMRRIIQSTAKPGQLIFEPFLGSGTTGVVARRYGYPFIGTDVSAKYCKAARDRIMSTVPLVAPSQQVLQIA